jgi:hypothetical protein
MKDTTPTEPPDERGTPVYKVVILLVGDQQGEIQVRMRVSHAPCIGPAEERGNHA